MKPALPRRRGRLRSWLIAVALLVGVLWLLVRILIQPGSGYTGPLPPLSPEQTALAQALRADVVRLATGIGERSVFRTPNALQAAAQHIEDGLRASGFSVSRQSFPVEGTGCDNVVGERAGSAEIVVVGAHYDSVPQCPGANDNGSGVAALLALARALASARPERTLRLVGFVNEEPPHFQTDNMGSLVYARACFAKQEQVVAMLSLETLGCYLDADGSQRYPPGIGALFPSKGNFVAFVANIGSRSLLGEVVETFRAHAQFPSEGAALPDNIPGVGWSDHWSFWQVGYPALMVTDTAVFRYREYHTPRDVPERIDFERLARVVDGLLPVVRRLARVP